MKVDSGFSDKANLPGQVIGVPISHLFLEAANTFAIKSCVTKKNGFSKVSPRSSHFCSLSAKQETSEDKEKTAAPFYLVPSSDLALFPFG